MTRTSKEIIYQRRQRKPFRFLRSRNVQETHHIVVKDGAQDYRRSQRAGVVKGRSYATYGTSDMIARQPSLQDVISWIDLSGLLPPEQKVTEEISAQGLLRCQAGSPVRRW